MNSLIPPLGATGLYKLATPYNNLIDANTSYECMATRYLSDIIKLGIDPYSRYYQGYGVDQSTYNTDLSSGIVAIVSLKDSSGNWYYVPSSYVTSYPNQGGISYTSMILGVPLGAIPDYLDLSSLKSKIESIVHDNLGITVVVQEAKVSKSKKITQSDHNSLEAARVANITDNKTDYAKYLEVKAQLAACQVQLAALQQWVAAHISTNP
jgi:hypothetical protein